MQLPNFILSSEECRLLLVLESTGCLRESARRLGRDATVISRQIGALSKIAPVVEKIQGKWQVSPLGKKMNGWTRDAILAQRNILEAPLSLRVVAPREFTVRVFVPQLKDFAELYPNVQISVLPSDDGVEDALLSGEADLAFACGKPHNPSIKYHRVTPEPFVIAASAAMGLQDYTDLEKFTALQHGLFSSLQMLPFHEYQSLKTIEFQDWASMRAACIAGLGWAIMPRYTIAREIAKHELIEISLPTEHVLTPEKYGVWWLRDRTFLTPWVNHALKWLEKQIL